MVVLERILLVLGVLGCLLVGWTAVGDGPTFVEQNLAQFAQGLAVLGGLYVLFFTINAITGKYGKVTKM